MYFIFIVVKCSLSFRNISIHVFVRDMVPGSRIGVFQSQPSELYLVYMFIHAKRSHSVNLGYIFLVKVMLIKCNKAVV